MTGKEKIILKDILNYMIKKSWDWLWEMKVGYPEVLKKKQVGNLGNCSEHMSKLNVQTLKKNFGKEKTISH